MPVDQIPGTPARAKDREFLVSDDIRPAVYAGQAGYLIRVRLTSYRSLPLSCIENIHLNLDGTPVESNCITFVLNGYGHAVSELGGLSHLWWWILDYADLFVTCPTPLTPGEHLVEGTLVTVEPYVTGGRFSFFYPSQKRLTLAAEL